MAHKGEDIKFTIKGDTNIRLDKLKDLSVSIYPCNKCNDESLRIELKRSDLTFVTDAEGNSTNTYLGIIPSSISTNMEEAYYNIEVLTVDSENNRSVYKSKHAFSIECSIYNNDIQQ